MAEHCEPFDGMECMCCYDDVDGSTYVEYQAEEGGPWLPSLFCENCIKRLLKTQWKGYVDSLAKATCKAEQRRLLMSGPPINLKDASKKALPCPEGSNGEVHKLWYSSDGEEHSAKLEGSLVGEERQLWWDEKSAFRFEEEDEAGDAEDDGEGEGGGDGEGGGREGDNDGGGGVR